VKYNLAFVLALILAPCLAAQPDTGIDPDAIIEHILAVDAAQREQIRDVTYDAEYIEKEKDGDGYKEKARFIKRITIMFLADTALIHEEYLECYKDGEPRQPKDCASEARDRLNKKRKRKSKDISFDILRPLRPQNAEDYEVTYDGLTDQPVNDHVCHVIRAASLVEESEHLNAEYYFDAETFQLVKVDFSPAKLPKNLMFKMKELNMSIAYGSTPEGYWLPEQFDIQGKGKAAFLFGVKFAGTEYYRNPQVNLGVNEDLFEVTND
jgi:hypothetical protein